MKDNLKQLRFHKGSLPKYMGVLTKGCINKGEEGNILFTFIYAPFNSYTVFISHT